MKQLEFERLSRSVLTLSRSIRSAQSLLKTACRLLEAKAAILLQRPADYERPLRPVSVFAPGLETLIYEDPDPLIQWYRTPVADDRSEGFSFGTGLVFQGIEFPDALVAFGQRMPNQKFPKLEMILLQEPGNRDSYRTYHCWAAAVMLREYEYFLIRKRQQDEMAFARKIQSGFLPERMPLIPGWELAARQLSARQTTGDFYDLISLPDNRWGVVIADVAGKGMGAALFMALSLTLIRTYARQYDPEPCQVFEAVSQRLMADVQEGLMVTAFYGILDPVRGTLKYCNAGHNPLLRMNRDEPDCCDLLPATGVPLNTIPDKRWESQELSLQKNDVIIGYTDGLTDARNTLNENFGSGRMMDVLRKNREKTAEGIRDALLEGVQAFVQDEPLFDDITLLVITRDL